MSSATPIRRVVDLSHPLEDATPVYPGDPPVRITPATTVAEHGYHVQHVRMGSQSGTHLDAPYHYLDDGERIDAVELSRLIAPAVMVDVRHRGAREAIVAHDLDAVSARLGPGCIVVFHTGWSRFWGDDAHYHAHPWLTEGAAQRLVDAGVEVVAIDAMSVDETIADGAHPTEYAAHQVLLGAGVIIVENLTGLDRVDFADPVLSVLPLKLAGADGAPCRAVMLDIS